MISGTIIKLFPYPNYIGLNSTDGHFGRLLFVQTNINTTWIFVYGTTTEFGNETKSFCDNVWPHVNFFSMKHIFPDFFN